MTGMETQIMMNAMPGRIVVLTCGMLLVSAGAYGHEAEGMFAKLLSLQVSEDISASGLGAGNNRIRKFSIPWHSDCQPGSGKVCAGIMARGSYMDVKTDMEDGDLFHWEAYGLSVGGDGTVKLSDTVSLRGGVSVGYSRIYNRSHIQDDVYWYPALAWKHKNVLFVSPEIEGMMTAGDFSLRTGISFLSASERSSGTRDIGTWAGSYFIRTAYMFRNAFTLTGRQGNIIVGNNTGGFYGAGYRDDLGFSLVNETQFLADIPFAWDNATKYIRTGPGLLLTDNGPGGGSFTFSLRM
ncbi:putative lipoprotein [Escherichia coli TA054]|nr:putative lipoprotein [Escherichia coli TA054]